MYFPSLWNLYNNPWTLAYPIGEISKNVLSCSDDIQIDDFLIPGDDDSIITPKTILIIIKPSIIGMVLKPSLRKVAIRTLQDFNRYEVIASEIESSIYNLGYIL